MITGLLLLVFVQGIDYYFPAKTVKIITKNGEKYVAQIKEEETIKTDSISYKRIKFKIANRDFYGLDYKWISENEIDTMFEANNAFIIERNEFGNFHGYIKRIFENNKVVNYSNENRAYLDSLLNYVSNLRDELKDIEKNKIGAINYQINNYEKKIRELKNKSQQHKSKYFANQIELEKVKYSILEKKVDSLRNVANNFRIELSTADSNTTIIPLINIVNLYNPNKMNFFDDTIFIINKIYNFITDDPRESNTEGGIFPAIFGTILMVILMSLAAVPFGVMAAIYLREYAKQGVLVQFIRIAVNNLAGVPSIVFGVFGLGFFIYTIGGTIDKLFYPEILPTPTWGTGGILWASLTLALLTVPVVIVSTEEAIASIPRGIREAALALGSTKWQVIKKIILPASTPGILTGIILAMARGAGEVAPLMITGVVKLAPNLPLDRHFPFFHLDRKFMHLGFHIYDVGFQSPNIEAALPMVYMTTLLLIFIVVLLNISAMLLRNKLRKKYKSSTF